MKKIETKGRNELEHALVVQEQDNESMIDGNSCEKEKEELDWRGTVEEL